MTWQFLGGVCAGAFISAAAVIFIPISASVPANGATAITRLEAVAKRNNLALSVWAYEQLFGLDVCLAKVESRGSDSFKVSRQSLTCEAAATEVLKTLEARNVR